MVFAVFIGLMYFAYTYFEYLKDLNFCELRIKLEYENSKVFTIAEAITDNIGVVDKDINIVFSNLMFQKLVKDRPFVSLLSENKYFKRYYKSTVSNEILDDIKEFFEDSDNETCFGIMKINEELIEWKGKKIL